jgi:TonB family protein
MMSGRLPDELPVMLNSQPPFEYPPVMYTRRVQGDVMLRLHVDRDGRVTRESTVVVQSSGHAELDSAAVQGAGKLRFVPAKSDGEPEAISVLFPVLFRHPEAKPMPGDTNPEGRTP